MDYSEYGTNEPKKQANFLLTEALILELKRLVPPGKRSLVVGVALQRELDRIKMNKAMGDYFGAWEKA